MAEWKPKEGMSYVVNLRPGSADEAAYKFEVPGAVLVEEGTIEALVNFGMNAEVPAKYKVVVGRLQEETKNGYGAKIGESVYTHPNHARNGPFVTEKVRGKFRKKSLLKELKDAKAGVEKKCTLGQEGQQQVLEALEGKINAIESGVIAGHYMRIDMVVADKLKGGYGNL